MAIKINISASKEDLAGKSHWWGFPDIPEAFEWPSNDEGNLLTFICQICLEEIAELAKPVLSIGNQYGEGWFLTGEMVELVKTGTPNIVCIQPFACLPNHVVGKGVIKLIRKNYPESNIVAVDYDPGASEVNQLNRIKLMLSAAKKKLENQTEN